MTALPNITEDTAPAAADLLYLYKSSEPATPDRKATVSNLFKDRALTGSCTAPTQGSGDNSTKIATTGFVVAAIADRAKIVAAPATAADAGTAGQIAYDASYLYVCIAANTWLRAGIATW